MAIDHFSLEAFEKALIKTAAERAALWISPHAPGGHHYLVSLFSAKNLSRAVTILTKRF